MSRNLVSREDVGSRQGLPGVEAAGRVDVINEVQSYGRVRNEATRYPPQQFTAERYFSWALGVWA